MTQMFDHYNALGLADLVAEWKFWDTQKARCIQNNIESREALKAAAHLDKLISAKNVNHVYMSLTDANGETVDWFPADSWA